MRVLLSGYDSRGGIEPLAGLAVALQALGAQVRVCAPPDDEFAQRLADVGVPLVPVGQSLRALVTGKTPPTAAGLPQRAAELVAAQFDKLAATAEGCNAVVATGVMPAVAGARSVAEKLGLHYSYATFQQLTLPSPHHPPRLTTPGKPFPPDVTDNRVLWDLEAQNISALFGEALNTQRAAIGLPPIDNIRDYAITSQPWLATDPTLDPWEPADLDVVQTGPWILPDERPLPAELVAFLDAGTPPRVRGLRQYAHAGLAGRCPGGHRRDPRAGPPRTGRPRLGGPGLDRRWGRLLRHRRGQPPGTVRPGRRRGAPWRGGYDDNGHPGRRASGGGAPGSGSAALGRPRGRSRHRRGTRWSNSDNRVPVSRAHDGPGHQDPHTIDRSAPHDSFRRCDGGRQVATGATAPQAVEGLGHGC
jgi:hypothetical protein